MTPTNNRWQVYDTSEPLLQWQLALPLPSSSSSSSSSASAEAAVVAAVRAALLPLVTVVGPTLPDVDRAFSAPAPFRSTVTVRDQRHALVDIEADDAGATLRRFEGPDLDPGYARRFAALGHPFVAVWSSTATTSTSSTPKTTPLRFGVTVAFFATIWFNDEDPALLARNAARLQAAHTALTTVARRHGGQLLAPTTLR